MVDTLCSLKDTVVKRSHGKTHNCTQSPISMTGVLMRVNILFLMDP